MAQALTIVMYHYIRDFARSRYPRIKGLELAGFRRQLDYLEQQFTIVTSADVIDATRSEEPLPPDAALLTFDDGYAEHFQTVFPILHERGLEGSFFPPVSPVRDHVLLDVNRVHFILASAPDAATLAESIDTAVRESPEDEAESVESYRAEWAHPNRYDDAETVYVKRMLQTALPAAMRERLTAALFERFVTSDEAAFASELYFTEEQARLMVASGMVMGSHGARHHWLSRVDTATQVDDVEHSLAFLRDVGVDLDAGWVMCYPYGDWNESLLGVIAERGCALGLTTEVRTASLGDDHPLLLPRYDTNDFPQ